MKDYLNIVKRTVFLGMLFGLMMAANPTAVLAEESEANEVEEEPTYFRTTSNLRLRTGPSLDDEIIRTIQTGSAVRVYDQRDGEWFSVNVNGTSGYMYAEFLMQSTAPSSGGQAGGGQASDGQAPSRPAEPQVNVYGVELICWWDDARNNAIRSGTPLHITDVRTGITYWVAAFSQGSHADVEPITQEDTNAMKEAFGGRWTWTPRPIWITVDGRTFAASINGMPHAGGSLPGNNMIGHICIHFYGSRTHSGSIAHERDHQAAVQEAFRASR